MNAEMLVFYRSTLWQRRRHLISLTITAYALMISLSCLFQPT